MQGLGESARSHAVQAEQQWAQSAAQASALAARQERYEDLQRAISDSSEQLLARSEQISASLQTVMAYQGRWAGCCQGLGWQRGERPEWRRC
jgi:hypothetical protein